MDNQQDQNQAEQDAQREVQQQQQRDLEAQDWAAQTPGAPETIAAPVAQEEAEPEAAAETENTIDPAINARITNPDLTDQERQKVAEAMMETDKITNNTFAMGAEVTASAGIMQLIQQFLGIGDVFSDMQQMSGRMFEAFDQGLVTEAGELNRGVVEPLIDDMNKLTPQQPAPQAPGTDPTVQTLDM